MWYKIPCVKTDPVATAGIGGSLSSGSWAPPEQAQDDTTTSERPKIGGWKPGPEATVTVEEEWGLRSWDQSTEGQALWLILEEEKEMSKAAI